MANYVNVRVMTDEEQNRFADLVAAGYNEEETAKMMKISLNTVKHTFTMLPEFKDVVSTIRQRRRGKLEKTLTDLSLGRTTEVTETWVAVVDNAGNFACGPDGKALMRLEKRTVKKLPPNLQAVLVLLKKIDPQAWGDQNAPMPEWANSKSLRAMLEQKLTVLTTAAAAAESGELKSKDDLLNEIYPAETSGYVVATN